MAKQRLWRRTTQNTAIVFGIALFVVFLVLAAQFESIASALVILFTVPFGLAAAALAIKLTGGTINVYFSARYR